MYRNHKIQQKKLFTPFRRLDGEIRTAIRGQTEVGHDGRQVMMNFVLHLVFYSWKLFIRNSALRLPKVGKYSSTGKRNLKKLFILTDKILYIALVYFHLYSVSYYSEGT